MSLGGFAIGKDGYVARRVIEPGELQPSVLRGTFRGLVGKRLCVAGREIPPDPCREPPVLGGIASSDIDGPSAEVPP